jgi:YaiO family outer membrane protein
MKKIIKWMGLLLAVVVLVSLIFYVKEKKTRPVISSDDLLKTGIKEIRNKHYSKAVTILRQALTISPNYTDVQVTLGRAYLLHGKLDSAKWYLRKAVTKDRNNPDAYNYLVNISMQEKDTAAAIAYLSDYLEYHPDNKYLTLKKYSLQLQYSQFASAGLTYKSYLSRFPADSINRVSFDYWQSAADMQKKRGEMRSAYDSYRKALPYQPDNTETLQQLVNLEIYYKMFAAAEHDNRTLLKQDSTNRRYLANASTINFALNRPELAADYAARTFASDPDNETSKKNLVGVYLALAKENDPKNKIRYARLVLQIEPSQKDALLYTINAHLAEKEFAEALTAANHALNYYPSDQTFIDKKVGILYGTKNYAACLEYLESVLRRYPNDQFIRTYDETALLLATEFIRDNKWNDALQVIRKGLAYNGNNRPLLEQLINVYASLGQTAEAIVIADELIAIEPSNAVWLFKKAGLLEKQKRFLEAADITYALLRQHPGTAVYMQAYFDELTNVEKEEVLQQQWQKVIAVYNRATVTGPPGYFAIIYALTAYTETGDHMHALLLTDTALGLYPGDSLFLVKRSLVHSSLLQFSQALTIDKKLLTRYPSDTSLQKLYLDQLYTAGKYYEKENNDTALTVFFTAFAFAPKDTFALQNLSAIYFVQKKYDSTVYYADLGLQLDSNNQYLLMKRASAYEQLKDYPQAYASASRLLQLAPSSAKIADYAAFLKNKTYQNQFGVSHLQSFFSSATQYASVTGLQYMRRFTKGSVTGKINLGNRPAGTAVQLGLDAYYTHNTRYYSNAFINWSPGTAFAYWQGGYSLFRNFKKGWEAELGVRYLDFDSVKNYTAVFSAGKYINNTWLNLRGFYTTDSKKWYQSYLLSARQYLNDKNDYLSAIAGLGGIPDDQSLNYNINRYAGFVSKTAGIGFQKNFRYRTTLNASFNYTNLQVAPKKTLNQYDFYITLLRNF